MTYYFRIAVIVVFGLLTYHSSAQAALICGAFGADSDCGTIITLGPTGPTIKNTGQGPYDGNDDTLVGVVNNSGVSVAGITLSSSLDIFGFDGDGIQTYGSPGNTKDKMGYGGPNSYFTNINSSKTTGTVNFITPIPNGGTAYFSLENALSSVTPCSQIVNGSVPKPPSGGSSIQTAFTPKLGLDLATAAADCGFMGFNWQQTTKHITDPFPFEAYNNGSSYQLSNSNTPYNDPPKGGGYTYSPGDMSYPFYCNSNDYGPHGVCFKTNTTLSLFDTPSDPCIPNPDGTASASFPSYAALCGGKLHPAGSYSAYTTDLIGVLPTFVAGTDCITALTCIDLGIGFSYTSTWNGTAGGVSVQKDASTADPGSGTGSVLVTDYQPDTTYEYDPALTITQITTDVPEPPSAVIMTFGIVLLLGIRIKRANKSEP